MKKLYEALNKQFNFEIESAYVYMAMAAYVDGQGMPGFNHFFVAQAKEEMEHARDFYNFMMEMDLKPEYAAIPAPKAEYKNFTDVFSAALAHEKEVTKRIKDIYKLALEQGCLDTQQFLNKYIEEQREEEDNFRNIVERLERINEAWNGLYLLDGQLGQRK